MKPVVVRSVNDADATRCVDVLRDGDAYAWVECRRDPEDATGWRRSHPARADFASEAAAWADARACVGWLAQDTG